MTRVGMIGVGSISRIHLDAWQRLPVEIAGHYDVAPEAAQQASERYGGRAYESMEALLADVDLVDICTPATAHKECVLAAAAAGVPIICEKPLARHLADCEPMIQACEEAGVPLYIAHVVRFFPQFAKAKAILDSGQLGKPSVIRTVRAGGFPRTGQSFYDNFEQSGGVILDVMIHDIDFVRWCFGEIERVFARGTTFTEEPYYDHVLATLRFTNGAIGHIESGWASPPGQWRTRLEIAGDEGLMEWDTFDKDTVMLAMRDPADDQGIQRDSYTPLAPDDNPYFAELAHFLDCVQNGTEPRVTAHDALMAVKISEAVTESVRTGQPIEIAQFDNTQFGTGGQS